MVVAVISVSIVVGIVAVSRLGVGIMAVSSTSLGRLTYESSATSRTSSNSKGKFGYSGKGVHFA